MWSQNGDFLTTQKCGQNEWSSKTDSVKVITRQDGIYSSDLDIPKTPIQECKNSLCLPRISKIIYRFLDLVEAVAFSWDSLRTFLTIFCSSIKKARTMRSLTQPAQREPP